MAYIDKQIKLVVNQEQRALDRYSDMRINLLYAIEANTHKYNSVQDAWHMVRYYEARMEECKTRIADWLQLFK